VSERGVRIGGDFDPLFLLKKVNRFYEKKGGFWMEFWSPAPLIEGR